MLKLHHLEPYTKLDTMLTLGFGKPDDHTVIFPGQEFQLLSSYSPDRSIYCYFRPELREIFLWNDLCWKIYADNSPFKEGKVRLEEVFHI